MTTMTAPAPTTQLDGQDCVAADQARVAEALNHGGRARLSVRSLKTGHHVTLSFSAKKRGEDGRFISRATKLGRVGMADADLVFIDDFHGEPVARFIPATGEVKEIKGVDGAKTWTARKLLAWVAGGFAMEDAAEVFMSLDCASCGRRLTDPVSVERGIGPECAGAKTGSKHA